MIFSLPKLNEIEISLFGAGSGYGECLLVHLGNNKWILVDSALNPITKKPIIDDYIKKIGVSYTAITNIIATHWHDDHIKGLFTVYNESENAKFFCSDSFASEEFFQIYATYKDLDLPNNGASEISKIIQAINERADFHRTLKTDQLFLNEVIDGIPLQVFSLSPSEYSCFLSRKELSSLLPIPGESVTGLKNTRPNKNCIVLLISFSDENILLAADIENEDDERVGLKGILKNSKILPGKKIKIYKVAHHGSKKSYNSDLWKNYLKEPISILTAFVLGRTKLPTQLSLDQIERDSEEVYITNTIPINKTKKRQFSIEKVIQNFKRDIFEYPYEYGHIRLRRMVQEKSSWNVDLDGIAKKYK